MQIYWEHLSFIRELGISFGVPNSDFEDFLQEAYLAVERAVKTYDKSRSTFRTYLRLMVLNQYFRWSLANLYLVSIPVKEYKKWKQSDQMRFSHLEEWQEELATSTLTEQGLETDLIWSCVYHTLSTKNADILWCYFVLNMPLTTIAAIYGIGWQRVQRRVQKSLASLRKSKELRQIARDCYGIIVKE